MHFVRKDLSTYITYTKQKRTNELSFKGFGEFSAYTQNRGRSQTTYSGLSNKRAARLFVSEEFFLTSRLLESTYQ